MAVKQCQECGESFSGYPSQLAKKTYCSRDCATRAKSRERTVEKVCEKCGEAFTCQFSKAKRRRFCSVECRRLASTKYANEAERLAAHAERERRKREARAARRPRKNSDPYEPAVYCVAEDCGKRLSVAAVNGGSEHCSRLCAYPPTPDDHITEAEEEDEIREPTATDLARL